MCTSSIKVTLRGLIVIEALEEKGLRDLGSEGNLRLRERVLISSMIFCSSVGSSHVVAR